MEKCDKTIIKLIEKCDNCKLNECINCEISYTEVQEIKKLLDRVTELEEDIEKEKTYYEFAKELIEKYHNLVNNIFKICRDNFIPKTKIREKIDYYIGLYEIGKLHDDEASKHQMQAILSVIEDLQEILEDK